MSKFWYKIFMVALYVALISIVVSIIVNFIFDAENTNNIVIHIILFNTSTIQMISGITAATAMFYFGYSKFVLHDYSYMETEAETRKYKRKSKENIILKHQNKGILKS